MVDRLDVNRQDVICISTYWKKTSRFCNHLLEPELDSWDLHPPPPHWPPLSSLCPSIGLPQHRSNEQCAAGHRSSPPGAGCIPRYNDLDSGASSPGTHRMHCRLNERDPSSVTAWQPPPWTPKIGRIQGDAAIRMHPVRPAGDLRWHRGLRLGVVSYWFPNFGFSGKDSSRPPTTIPGVMGSTTSCCVSCSPKLRRNAHSRLESYQQESDLSREETGCNLQHISDRENVDGKNVIK